MGNTAWPLARKQEYFVSYWRSFVNDSPGPQATGKLTTLSRRPKFRGTGRSVPKVLSVERKGKAFLSLALYSAIYGGNLDKTHNAKPQFPCLWNGDNISLTELLWRSKKNEIECWANYEGAEAEPDQWCWVGGLGHPEARSHLIATGFSSPGFLKVGAWITTVGIISFIKVNCDCRHFSIVLDFNPKKCFQHFVT